MDADTFFTKYIFLVFPLLYVFNTFVLSWLGGWRRLADKYRFDDDFDGNWKIFQRGYVGIVRYNGLLWVGTSAKGIYLKTGPLFVFRLFHPPLFIPWSGIKKISEKNFLFVRNLKIEIEDPKVKLTLPQSCLNDSVQYWEPLMEWSASRK